MTLSERTIGVGFVHLRCHSNFSLLAGASGLDELLEAAQAAGLESLALSDTNGLYAAVPFQRKARERGLRPIFGAVLTGSLERGATGPDALVLARDREGFAAVSRLVTARHLESGFSLSDALAAEAARAPESLFVLSADPGLLQQLAAALPPGMLYAELCHDGAEGAAQRLRRTAELARSLGLPCAATGGVFFARPEGHDLHRLLRAMDLGHTTGSLRAGDCAPEGAFLAPSAEMERRLAAWPAALANTFRLAEQCRVELPVGRMIFPEFHLPDGESAYSLLLKNAFRGACRRYRPLTAPVLERLRAELEVIDRQGFSPYFLVVADIARFARRRRIPMVGRGSAANSLVAYALGITDVDPIRYNLFFERFLNPERHSPPDIDLDFSWRRRDEVLEYVYRTYGADRVAMICTYVTFSARLAFRETAKALGLPPEEIGRFTRIMPGRTLTDPQELAAKWPETRSLPLEEEPWRTVVALARRLAGFPRHLSMHAGGIVVAPFPLTDMVPLARSAKGFVVTQYDMFPVEELGLVKIDLLSQRALSVNEEVSRQVERRSGVRLDLEDTDRLAADPEVVRLVSHGRTMGCFYIESPAMRQLLEKLRVRTFEELTAASSVIRPGVAESGMLAQYVDRHRGRAPVEYLHPKLKELLGETYGVMVYQEDVIRVAHAIAGMSLGQADLLRRAMSGKLRSHEAMEALERQFVEASTARGVERSAAVEIWRQIRSFAGYAFCKAHSASYARISFQSAYLKVHYPAEFMAAVLANGGGFYGPSAYLEEARRMGLDILPPDVNRSGIEYSGEAGWVRVGLNVIAGLTRRTLERTLQSRAGEGFFTSLADYCRRVGPGYAEAQTLIRCGVFDSFELTRPELLWRLELLFERGKLKAAADSGCGALALGVESGECGRRVAPRLPEYPRVERLRLEREIFGFTVSEHPLALGGRFPPPLPGLVRAAELRDHAGRNVRLLGRPIAWKRIRTGSGAMMFLSLDDPTAAFEVVIFPRCYKQCGALALGPGPFLVSGRASEEYGVVTVTAERLERFDPEEISRKRMVAGQRQT